MRRLIVCFDGTWFSSLFEPDARRLSNIARLHTAIGRRDGRVDPPIEQLKLYVEGVGTGQELVEGLASGAFGLGVMSKVRQAYYWISQNYEDGDEVHLYGFSRGAYTARLVASLISLLGILDPETTLSFFPRLFFLLCEERTPWTEKGRQRERELEKLLHQARGRRAAQIAASRDGFLVQILGCFDSVRPSPFAGLHASSPIRKTGPFGTSDEVLEPEIGTVLQALALNEDRLAYSPVVYRHDDPETANASGRSLLQLWFPGCHKDIGGGYIDHDLSDLTLDWLVSHVEAHLALSLDYVRDVSKYATAPWGQLEPHRGLGRFLFHHHRSPPGEFDPTTQQFYHPSCFEQPRSALPEPARSLSDSDTSPIVTKLTEFERLWWLVIVLTVVATALLAYFEDPIIDFTSPKRQAIIETPFSWVFPLLILVLLSFPPLGGRGLALVIIGLIWGAWMGCAIAAVGIMLGEVVCFFVFRTLFAEKAKRMEEKNLFFALTVIRYSFIPSRFVSATQSISGMSCLKYSVAVFLSLPKSLAAVWLGDMIGRAADETAESQQQIASIVLLVISVITGVVALVVVYIRARKLYPEMREKVNSATSIVEEASDEEEGMMNRGTRKAGRRTSSDNGSDAESDDESGDGRGPGGTTGQSARDFVFVPQARANSAVL
ncbi:hypothetical protein JCM10212_004494 [Sporobolomyces blumeae]